MCLAQKQHTSKVPWKFVLYPVGVSHMKKHKSAPWPWIGINPPVRTGTIPFLLCSFGPHLIFCHHTVLHEASDLSIFICPYTVLLYIVYMYVYSRVHFVVYVDINHDMNVYNTERTEDFILYHTSFNRLYTYIHTGRDWYVCI
jgi:hypothetical protein